MAIDEVLVFVDGTWDVVCGNCAAAADPALAGLASLAAAAATYAGNLGRGPGWADDEADYSAAPGREIELPVHHYKGARRPWCALLTARDERYRFSREYLDTVPIRVDPGGQFGDYVCRIRTEGVYQTGDAGDRSGYWLCWQEERGLRLARITEHRAGAIIDMTLLGTGLDEARRISRPRLDNKVRSGGKRGQQ